MRKEGPKSMRKTRVQQRLVFVLIQRQFHQKCSGRCWNLQQKSQKPCFTQLLSWKISYLLLLA